MKESELYPPLKGFLEAQDYEVKAEIQGCDVLAVRGDETPVVVELKRALNLDVVLQAVDRLALTPKVYIGIPLGCAALKRRRRHVVKLIKILGLGLLLIDMRRKKWAVEILVDPAEYRPRPSKPRTERLLGEFAKRVGDPNVGGITTRHGIMTAYRQRALDIADFLKAAGPSKAKTVREALDEPQARDILYRNVYGWFERVSRGVYGLSPRGGAEIPQWRERR